MLNLAASWLGRDDGSTLDLPFGTIAGGIRQQRSGDLGCQVLEVDKKMGRRKIGVLG